MHQAIADYFSELSDKVARAWNEFWFLPRDLFPLCVLRILVGVLGLYFVLSHSADLIRWFGPNGLLPAETVVKVENTIDLSDFPAMRFSLLNFVSTPGGLWSMHAVSIATLIAMTIGLYSRVATIASLIVVLSYVHRAPFITGQFEPLLTLMLFYLCLAPTGKFLSLDAFLKRRREKGSSTGPQETTEGLSVAANVATRLMQVHVSLLYLTMCLSKLSGPSWWDGAAVWWLVAAPDSGLVNLEFLHSSSYLVYFWTHLIPLFEGFFALLIWNRMLRPLLLGWAVFMWLSLAMITGLISFALMMLVINLVFVSPEMFRTATDWCINKVGLSYSAAAKEETATA